MPIGENQNDVVKYFISISFTHVFRELNRTAGRLSKEGILLAKGTMGLEEVMEEVLVSSHINF